MDDNYIKLLADILWKAQGRIDAETGETIDIGDEVQKLRNICDRLQVDSETLKHVSEQSQPVPEGYVMVPVEPTREMLIDGAKAARDFLSEAGQYPRSRAVYRAMLATAPKPGGES